MDTSYLPLLKEMGDGWHEGRISISQEHFASAFIRERMLAMLVAVGFGPSGRTAYDLCLYVRRAT